jgi:hypothetical protein
MSRLRRPAGRLRDLPIWSKLGLIMLVPTLATIIVGVSGLVDHIDEASNAERARTLAVLSQNAGDLVDHLQNERAYGVMIMETPDGRPGEAAKKKAKQSFGAEHAQVDAAKVPYARSSWSWSTSPPAACDSTDRVRARSALLASSMWSTRPLTPTMIVARVGTSMIRPSFDQIGRSRRRPAGRRRRDMTAFAVLGRLLTSPSS